MSTVVKIHDSSLWYNLSGFSFLRFQLHFSILSASEVLFKRAIDGMVPWCFKVRMKLKQGKCYYSKGIYIQNIQKAIIQNVMFYTQFIYQHLKSVGKQSISLVPLVGNVTDVTI